MMELVIVLLITSIFAAVAAPAFFQSLLFHRVESAARRVKADLEMARQQARLTSATLTVVFTNFTGSYTISGGLKGLDNPNGTYSVNLKKSPYSLDSATANFAGGPTVLFDGYGSPSAGGTVVLTAKTHQCTVSLDSTTGAVTIISNHASGGSAQVTGT